MAAEELLDDVRNYLDITYEDQETDSKLLGIIGRGMGYLDSIAGAGQDYGEEGAARALLFDYCRYARANVLEQFSQAYGRELVSLRIGVQADEYAEANGYV